jgi:hypothetical protein
MTLKEYKDYFKQEFRWEYSISIGKIDNNQEKAICFYNSKRNSEYVGVFGGIKNKSTNIKPITILLRYTKNQNDAEIMAQKIYDFYNERSFFIDSKRVFVEMIYNEPINLGTDDNNVYEYSIELNFYEER